MAGSGAGPRKKGDNGFKIRGLADPGSSRQPISPAEAERQISPDETTGALPPSPEKVEEISHGIHSVFEQTPPVPRGFLNPSNICYRNAVITMLLNIPTFSNFLHEVGLRQETLQAVGDAGGLAPPVVTSALVELNKTYNMEMSKSTKRADLSNKMNDFFKRFIIANPTFTREIFRKVLRQEDADDFLCTLLNCMEEELITSNDPTMLDVLQTLNRFRLLERSYCLNGCQTNKQRATTATSEAIRRIHLSAGLPAGQTHRTFVECLDASLNGFGEPGDVERWCDNCQKKTWRRTSSRFVKLPKLFLTTFSRNTQDVANRKIETDCPLPPSFVPLLDEKVAEKFRKEGKTFRYRLSGVVVHQGATGKSGHNISYVPNHAEPGHWYTLDDARVHPINFDDINRFDPTSKMPRPLPYIMAWELIEGQVESDKETVEPVKEVVQPVEETARPVTASYLETQGKLLKHNETLFCKKVKEVADREHSLEKKEKKLREKMKEAFRRELDLVRRELDLARRESEFHRIARQEAEAERLGKVSVGQEQTPDQRGNQPPRAGQGKQVSSSQGAPTKVKSPLEQEVDEGKDRATFCATFHNANDHEEQARAMFKIKDFRPDVPIKIESRVQLSDLDGNLRPIKKGTVVHDHFFISFNARGGKKRKADADDHDDGDDRDEDASSPPKKKRQPAKKVKFNEPQPPRKPKPSSKKQPPPRRSTRTTKGRPPGRG